MSRGPGRLMIDVCGALSAAAGPLTFADIATTVYGSRTVTRYTGGRRRHAEVPDGDASNLRRAIKSLLRSGKVVEVRAALEAGGRRGQIRYDLSDRSTWNWRGRQGVEAADTATGGLDATTRHVSRSDPGVAAEGVPSHKELTDQERELLDFLADTAVGILETRLAQGEAPELGVPAPLSMFSQGRTHE
jgi:hypothetical protein